MHTIIKHIILALVVFTSCENSKLSPDDYIRWMRNNKDILTASKEIEGIEFNVQYQPVELLVLNEIKKQEDFSPEQYARRIKERGDMEHYVISVSLTSEEEFILKHELKSESDYYQRIKYYSFHINKDLQLVQDGDTVDCLIHHFERSYGVSPGITITAGFPAQKDKKIKKRTLIIQDPVFNRGKINITLKYLHKIPSIRI